MKKTLSVMALVSCLFIAACGSEGGDSCDFNISSITNGASLATATSIWSCTAGNLTFTDDGAGLDSSVGAFTWSETGCRSLSVNTASGSADITELSGSTASNVMTFRQDGEMGSGDESCVLVNL